MRALRSLCSTLAFLGVVPARLLSQQVCDPALKPASGELYPYALRGDRCEGQYEIELSANEGLPVVGLMLPGRNIDFRNTRRVYVRWKGQPGIVRLQAGSLRWRTYYRMDTVRPTSTAVFTWPTFILGALNFHDAEIAVLAWRDDGLTTSRRVHLPVAVDTSAALHLATAYELVIVPTTEFARIHMTLYHVLPGGGLQLVGPANAEVGEPPFNRDAAIRVSLPLTGTLAAGEYEIWISGERLIGGWVHTVFRFRHDTNPL